jgi:hypothetical protein
MVEPEEIKAGSTLDQMHYSSLRLFRAQPQVGQQAAQPFQRGLRLCLRATHHHGVVAVPDEHPVLLGPPFPVQPVQVDVGQQRGGDAANAMGNFCFDVTLSYRRLERPRRVSGEA